VKKVNLNLNITGTGFISQIKRLKYFYQGFKKRYVAGNPIFLYQKEEVEKILNYEGDSLYLLELHHKGDLNLIYLCDNFELVGRILIKNSSSSFRNNLSGCQLVEVQGGCFELNMDNL
jgi:hypothetical protein